MLLQTKLKKVWELTAGREAENSSLYSRLQLLQLLPILAGKQQSEAAYSFKERDDIFELCKGDLISSPANRLTSGCQTGCYIS